MPEKYWLLLFPHYVLFGTVISLCIGAALSVRRGAQILRVAIFLGVLWTVLVFVEVVLPHAKNF